MKLRKIISTAVQYGVPALALFFITVSILHDYNPGMMYLTNNSSLLLLRVFGILGILGFFVREPHGKKE